MTAPAGSSALTVTLAVAAVPAETALGDTATATVFTTPFSVTVTSFTWPAVTVTGTVATDSGVPVPSVLANVENWTDVVPTGTGNVMTHVNPAPPCVQFGELGVSENVMLVPPGTVIVTDCVSDEM